MLLLERSSLVSSVIYTMPASIEEQVAYTSYCYRCKELQPSFVYANIDVQNPVPLQYQNSFEFYPILRYLLSRSLLSSYYFNYLYVVFIYILRVLCTRCCYYYVALYFTVFIIRPIHTEFNIFRWRTL